MSSMDEDETKEPENEDAAEVPEEVTFEDPVTILPEQQEYKVKKRHRKIKGASPDLDQTFGWRILLIGILILALMGLVAYVLALVIQNEPEREEIQSIEINPNPQPAPAVQPEIEMPVEETPMTNENLETTTYTTSDTGPEYSLLFLKNSQSSCSTDDPDCTSIAGSLEGADPIRLTLSDTSLDDVIAAAFEDETQCEEALADLGQSEDSQHITPCTVLTSTNEVLYYSFEMQLNDETHYALITGVDDGVKPTSVPPGYEDIYFEIIKSIELN